MIICLKLLFHLLNIQLHVCLARKTDVSEAKQNAVINFLAGH